MVSKLPVGGIELHLI